MTEEQRERARKIHMVVMDVDGTLTDGAMYYSAEGEAMKRFDTRDGMGLTLLRRAGYRLAIITSEQSQIAQKRAEKLRIDDVILGSHDKTTSLKELARKHSLALESIAYIGDDVNDEHVMSLCGLTACPSDAAAVIRNTAHVCCTSRGGHGAVREFAEMILTANGHPVTLTENWS